MKGFIYMILMYTFVFSISLIVKFIINDRKKDIKSEGKPAPAQQIFYIKNASVRRKKPTPKPTDITIRGNIVDDNRFNTP